MKPRSLFAIVLLTLAMLPGALSSNFVPHSSPATPEEIREIIARKIDFYNKEFPQLRFVHLEGGADWHGDMIAMLMLLGADPDNLDYEHPPSLQADLLSASVDRIKQLLQQDIISASTFRVGQKSQLDRQYMCVITLNPLTVVGNDYEATRHMLDLPNAEMAKVHPVRYLDHRDHLEFAVDHEVYHCLDSFHYGGIPQNKDPMKTEYHSFRRESAADAYAMIMHLKTRGKITPYARNIVHIRALWMFADTPNRCTFETIRETLRYDPAFFTTLDTDGVMELARHIRDRTVGTYDAYLQQRAAALKAARQLGYEPKVYGEHWSEMEKRHANPALIKFLLNRYHFYYRALFSGQPVPLEAPVN